MRFAFGTAASVNGLRSKIKQRAEEAILLKEVAIAAALKVYLT